LNINAIKKHKDYGCIIECDVTCEIPKCNHVDARELKVVIECLYTVVLELINDGDPLSCISSFEGEVHGSAKDMSLEFVKAFLKENIGDVLTGVIEIVTGIGARVILAIVP
jgi:hypothetical protein